MTENERLTVDEIIEHCNRTCENTEMLAIARGQNQEDITSKGYWEHYQVANYLEELKQYTAIGTVEEFKNLKENERKCEDCAGCTNWLCDCANERNKAIDDAKETVAKAICVGCGYLDGYKCNYKGANCGVSKPMLESVVKALEQMKGAVQ